MKNLISIYLILISAVAGAQTLNGRIYGMDADSQMSPLPGATLVWLADGSGTITDPDGFFFLDFPGGEDLRLQISFVGYRTDTIKVDTWADVDIMLLSDLILDDVVIAEEKSALAINTSDGVNKITMNERELLKAACCNLSESFETNVTVDAEYTDAVTGTRTIRMLGLDGVYALITADGIPVVRGLASGYGLSYIPGTWIREIDLTKGPGSVENGYEGISGWINARMKSPGPQPAEKLFVNVYGNSLGRWEANANAAAGIGKSLHTGLLVHTMQSQLDVDHNADGFLDMPLGETYTIMNNWVWNNSKHTEIRAGAKWTAQDIQGGQLSFDPQQARDTLNGYGVGLDARRMESYLNAGYSASRPETVFTWHSTGIWHDQSAFYGLSDYSGQETYYRSDLSGGTYIGNTDHLVRAGVSFLYNRFDEQFRDLFMDRTEIVPGWFAQYQFKLKDKVSVMAGYRMDMHNLYGTFQTPRLHLRYSPTTKTTWRASVAKGYRVANVLVENAALLVSSRDLIIADDLLPEEAWNTGITYIRRFPLFNRTSSITADYYHTWFVNQVVTDRDASAQTILIDNLDGRSGSDVAQLEWNVEPVRHLDIRMAYRYTWSYSTFGGELMELPLVNRHRAMLNASWNWQEKGWQADATLHYFGSARLPDLSDNLLAADVSGRSPAYVQLMGQLTRSWDTFSWYAGVENATGYTQQDPIIGAGDPFGPNFDASVLYAPLMAARIYSGIRLVIQEKQEQ